MAKQYKAIDGLRALACIGIVMMHVAKNNVYAINGFVYDTIIPSFADFVFLFMAISAFGMCCGYHGKMLLREIDLTDFYKKRFMKILPFFSIMVFFDVALSPSVDALYEAFADLTLLFGLLPDGGNISVIGVGWFLGVVFVFYLLFPFFCVLTQNKKRAWVAFAVSLIYNFVCTNYFYAGKENILYSSSFFLAGGLIFLYRESLERVSGWLGMGMCIVSIILYYLAGGKTIECLLVSSALLSYTVMAGEKRGLLKNRITQFISGISMELYLSHMAVFRIIEKLGFNRRLGDGVLQYVITVLLVVAGSAVFSIITKKSLKRLWRFKKQHL